jgi:membrane fusion protein (multidrug efflux system)
MLEDPRSPWPPRRNARDEAAAEGSARVFPLLRRTMTALRALPLLAVASCGGNSAAAPAPSPPEVVVQTVEPEDVSIYADTVGTLEGMVNAEIRARVPGHIQEQSYPDGTFVKAGQLLFTIDPSLTQAAAKRARGDLDGARAALAKAELDVNRTRSLQGGGLTSQQALDNALAVRDLAAANLTTAQGSLDTALANLSYTKIVSPISGLAGIARVRVGTLVGQSEPTLLTTVSQIDPIRVSYGISEQTYLANAKKFQGQDDPGTPPTLELFLADRSLYPHRGRLSFLDRQVDPTTGTITAMATFPNPDALLRPGLYGKVRDLREVRKGALLVPQRAVTELQGSYQVVVVGPGDKAEVRTVAAGERVENRWIINTGLKPGDRVVVEGLQKVKDGMIVAPRASAAPPSPSASASSPPAGK